MTALSVNLNKIALLRNARGKNIPDVAAFGRQALDCGAAGLTVHPRPDQRHARHSDLDTLAALIAEYDGRELNVEAYPAPEFLEQVCRVRPHQCTLVPDAPDQLTSDHGWDARPPETRAFLGPVIHRLHDHGIRVSLFIDPDPALAAPAAETGTDRVELYTERYAEAHGTAAQEVTIHIFRETAAAARDLGLGVNAGHDLNLENLGDLVRAIPWIEEVSIGHALTVEALQYGWDPTIAHYLKILAAATEP